MKGIYKITNPSGKIYIGQAVDINKRISLYKLGHCKKQIALYASILKHGWDNHIVEVLEECDNLDEREIYYISLYDTYNTPHGLNLRAGGSTCKWSEESKAKLSKSMKGKTRPDLSLINKNRKGTKMPEGFSEKISILNTGKKHSDETKAKMAAKAKLWERSEQTKLKMSESAKNKTFTPEHRAKMLESRLNSEKTGKKVINIETGQTYKNLVYLCNLFGYSYGSMKSKLNGKNKNNTPYKYLLPL